MGGFGLENAGWHRAHGLTQKLCRSSEAKNRIEYGGLTAANSEIGSHGMYKLRYFHQIFLAAIITGLFILSAEADAPTGEGGSVSCSNNKKYCVGYDEAKAVTIIFYKHNKNVKVRWTIPVIIKAGTVSNQGDVVVKLPDTANLLPFNSKADTPVLTFYTISKKVTKLTLKQVIKKPNKLPRTSSHLHWAISYGFDTDGMFILNTVENASFRINPYTGSPMNRKYFDRTH